MKEVKKITNQLYEWYQSSCSCRIVPSSYTSRCSNSLFCLSRRIVPLTSDNSTSLSLSVCRQPEGQWYNHLPPLSTSPQQNHLPSPLALPLSALDPARLSLSLSRRLSTSPMTNNNPSSPSPPSLLFFLSMLFPQPLHLLLASFPLPPMLSSLLAFFAPQWLPHLPLKYINYCIVRILNYHCHNSYQNSWTFDANFL